MQLAVPQKRLGPRSLLASVLVIGILMIMPIDLYVPALPVMQKELEVSASALNLTMFAFLFFSIAGVVLAGPVSDRIGRRPLLVASCVLYLISSVGCALAPNLPVLVAFRMGQALAYGTEATVQTALVGDAYSGKDRQLAMTLVQSLLIVGPAIAPFLGSALVVLLGWRGVFWCMAVFGVACTVLALVVSETLPVRHRTSGGVAQALAGTMGYATSLVRDRRFVAFVAILGLAAIPYFAWIATVSYDLIDFFGASYLDYCVCYAVTCIATVVAPYVYLFLSKRWGVNAITWFCFACFGVTFALLVVGGTTSPLFFTLAFLPFTLGEGVVRPMAFVILLDQEPEAVGAASTIANMFYGITSSLATVLATLPWPNYIVGLTVLMGAALVLQVAMFLWSGRQAE